MPMDDWNVTNYRDPTLGGTWVYYESAQFPGIHFSRCVDDPRRDHMATNDQNHYYYGVTRTFNGNPPQSVQQNLTTAWADFFTVA